MKVYNHLKALYYFLVTARCLSIKRAADELYVTQAAVSQQIRLLEEALGVALFHRQHRAIALTQEGLNLLPHIELAFSSIAKGIDGLRADKDPTKITLSVLPSFASRWLIPRLGSFYEAHPGIAINLTMTEKLESFDRQDIDLAIRFGLGRYDDIESRPLMGDYLYPAAHPDYLKKHVKKNGIDDINKLKELRLLDDAISNLSWDHWLDKKGFKKNRRELNRVRYEGSHYVIDSALSAQGVAMVRHSLVAEAVAQKQLVRLSGEPVELDYQYFLCAPRHHFDFSKIKIFSAWLLQQVGDFSSRYSV